MIQGSMSLKYALTEAIPVELGRSRFSELPRKRSSASTPAAPPCLPRCVIPHLCLRRYSTPRLARKFAFYARLSVEGFSKIFNIFRKPGALGQTLTDGSKNNPGCPLEYPHKGLFEGTTTRGKTSLKTKWSLLPYLEVTWK